MLKLADVPRLAGKAMYKVVGLKPLPQPPVIPLRYPVVMMHGFGFLAALRRHGHLHDEALNLRLHGVRAYAPNVAPYNRVPARAETWKAHIEHVLDECGCDRVNLIAHSMGGLDARYLISRLGMHEVVASLTTVSTPHHGTYLATYVLEQPDLIQARLSDLANWMGVYALEGSTADFLACVSELTPAYLREGFNPETPDHPLVRYWSYAGACGKGTDAPINPLLRYQNALLYRKEGVNDGFVPVESARWGAFLGTIPADHTAEVGLRFAPRSTFSASDFYVEVARHLYAEGL